MIHPVVGVLYRMPMSFQLSLQSLLPDLATWRIT